MKNILGIVLAALFFTGCKKQYSCECSVHSQYINGDSETNHSEIKEYNRKMKKKEAQAACEHESEAIKTTFMNSYTENGTQAALGGVTVTCVLK